VAILKKYRTKIIGYLIWVVAALFTSTQLYLKSKDATGEGDWIKLFLIQLLVWSVWALFTPTIFLLGKRFRIGRQTNYKGILLHLIFAVVIVLTYLAIYSVIWNFLGIGSFSLEAFRSYFKLFFLNLFHWHFFIYMAIIGIAHALEYHNESVIRKKEAIDLERQLLISELNMLKAQLSPHFLFNTINNVISTVEQGKNALAVGMLIRLGAFLRHSLEQSKHSMITLEKELSYIDSYLEIEKFRNQELEVITNKSHDCLNCLVPNFILQPIVENAIKHGISKMEEANRIEIGMEKTENKLRLWVYNEGPSIRLNGNKGIGLSSTISRIQNLFKGTASFNLLSVNDGAMAEFYLPIVAKE